MTEVLLETKPPTATDLELMHATHLQGGKERGMAPQIVYADSTCPHEGCDQQLQAIDFRVEAYGKSVRDPLVLAWWNDTGFAGQCPSCRRWIHFTIRDKRAITVAEAATLPKLPDDWHNVATIL